MPNQRLRVARYTRVIVTRHAATALLLFFCLAASRIVRNGKTGFIDIQGNMVVGPQFARG
jgi:hypothetical protein